MGKWPVFSKGSNQEFHRICDSLQSDLLLLKREFPGYGKISMMVVGLAARFDINQRFSIRDYQRKSATIHFACAKRDADFLLLEFANRCNAFDITQ